MPSQKWTEPALKYGPTLVYGRCEASECEARARTTCISCKAHVCFGHSDHAAHEAGSAAQK